MPLGKKAADRRFAGATQAKKRNAPQRATPIFQIRLKQLDRALLLGEAHAAHKLGESAIHRVGC
jgi:hypothetical protein